MNRKTLLILLALTIAIIAALFLYNGSEGDEQQTQQGLLFPELAQRGDDIARVEIQTAGSAAPQLVLEKQDGVWGVASKGGYPIATEALQKLLTTLAQSEVAEAMTSNPEFYYRLGVDDINQDGSEARALRVKTADGESLGAVLFGNTTKRGGGLATYVRAEGQAQSGLVFGSVELKTDASAWLQRGIVDIARDQVKAVSVSHADGDSVELRREKADDVFELSNKPAGRELMYASVVNTPADALRGLKLDDVQPVSQRPLNADKTSTTVYELFDGRKLEIKAERDGPKYYAEFAWLGEGVDNSAWQGWVFNIPTYKYNQIARRMSDMLKALPEPTAEESSAAEVAADEMAASDEAALAEAEPADADDGNLPKESVSEPPRESISEPSN